MIVAAAVITRPVAAWPIRTEWPLSSVLHPLLVHAADQEHLVVHREPEQDREHHHRQERLDRPGPDPERPGEEALLEDEGDDAERRAGGEQVHHRRGQRDQHAAERDHQQQAAEQRRSRR